MSAKTHLPQELIPESNPWRVAWIVLGTSVVLGAINLAAWVLAQRMPLSHDVNMTRSKWRILRESEPGLDCLVVGDSSGNFGVVPEVLEAELGWDTRNACTMGRFLSVGDAWMLREFIDLHGPPSHVVSVHAVRRWEETLAPASLAQVPLPFGFWNEAPVLDLSWQDERDVFLARFLPLYSSHLSLARWLREGRVGIENPIAITDSGRGLLPKASPAGVTRKAIQFRKQLAARQELAIEPANVLALETMRDLADEYGFRLYLAHGPVFDGLAKTPAYRRYLKLLNAHLAGFAASSPNVEVVLRNPVRFDKGSMENPNHLVGDAPEAYTRRLAAALGALQ